MFNEHIIKYLQLEYNIMGLTQGVSTAEPCFFTVQTKSRNVVQDVAALHIFPLSVLSSTLFPCLPSSSSSAPWYNHTHTHPHHHISHTHGNHVRCWCSEKKVCGWLFSSFFYLSEGLILQSCSCCFLLFVSCHHFLDLRNGLSWVQSLWRHGSNRQWETKTLLTLWECVCECFWSTLGHVLVQFMIVWQR